MKRNMKIPTAVAAILIAMGYLMYSGISDTGVYYRTVNEVLDQASILDGQGLRISGEVVEGTVQYDQNDLLLNFSVRDTEKNDVKMRVRYYGVMPDAFKESAEVILEGTYSQYDNLFSATVLLAKCPSKYEAESRDMEQASR